MACFSGRIHDRKLCIISLGSQKIAYDSSTYDLATTDITTPEVTFIPRALWKSNKEDDGDNLRTDDLRQRFLSRLPQQCWVALGSKPVAPFKDWGPKVCGSEDATEADGQVIFLVMFFLWPSCPFQYAFPNLGQTFVNMIESISLMPLRIYMEPQKVIIPKRKWIVFHIHTFFFPFLFLAFLRFPKNPLRFGSSALGPCKRGRSTARSAWSSNTPWNAHEKHRAYLSSAKVGMFVYFYSFF